LKEQLLLAKDERYDELEECLGAFSMKFGLPCKHTLHRQLNEPGGLVIDLKDIHQHWWYHPPRARGEEVQDERYILDPEKIRPKGRPQGSTTVTLPSTQVSQSLRGRQPQRQPREKTRNEHVQATQQTQQAEEASDDDIEPRRGNRRPNDRILGVLEKVLANQAELSKRLQAVEKPQQVHNDFININSIDIDHNSPPKQPRKKRKAL
ncbi:hypothetical protein A1F97_11292, partial [Pyrenophora tritici-repentis]